MPDLPDLPTDLEQPEVVSLAGDVLDGTAVDWGTASSAVGADYAAEFRVVATLAALHRGVRQPILEAAQAPTPDGAAILSTWGPLTLLERIGAGAFGVVYRARDEALHREVALKLLLPTRSVDEGIATVEEGRLLARIQHDNVVRVFGAQRIGPEVGLWTEFIHGRTLAEIVRDQGWFSAQEAATTGIAICRALSAAHRVGILHRDVKPQNVMREDGGRIVLLDFGAGRDWRSAIGTGSNLAGTPWYLAPELIAGQPPAPAADLYSLGVLLFFLVTGDVPVKGTTVDALRAIHDQGASLKLRDARPDLPAAFVAVVERALRPNPADRFESAGAFESALAETTVKARDATVDRRGALTWTRQHGWLVAALTLSLITVAGLTALLWHRSTTPIVKSFVPTRLTINSPEFPALQTVAISPDGKFLAYVKPTGLEVQSPPNGDARRVVDLKMPIDKIAWLPDSTGILLSGAGGVWRTSVFGEPLRQVSSRGGMAAVSRDGRVALTTTGGQSIHLLGVDFVDRGEVAHADGGVTFGYPTWSPDGRRIAYGVRYLLPGDGGPPSRRTIETRRADGSDRVEVFRGPSLLSYVWATDDRILFSRLFQVGNRYGELCQVLVNPRTGQPVGAPERLWQPADVSFSSPSVTADGRQLVYYTSHQAAEVDVSAFDSGRSTLEAFRRIFSRDNGAGPLVWTVTGDGLLFHEMSPGNPDGEVRRQLLTGGSAQIVLSNHREIDSYALTADGRFLLSTQVGVFPGIPRPAGPRPPAAVLRAPASGGAETPLFATPIFSTVRCARRAPQVCVVGAPADQAHLSVFDPAVGHPRLLASLPYAHSSPSSAGAFDLTADGTHIAALSYASEGASLVVIDVSSGQLRQVHCDACVKATGVMWAADDHGWLVTTANAPGHSFESEIWFVDRRGVSTKLWQSPYQLVLDLVLSPDGRRVAFTMGTIASSVWKLEGF